IADAGYEINCLLVGVAQRHTTQTIRGNAVDRVHGCRGDGSSRDSERARRWIDLDRLRGRCGSELILRYRPGVFDAYLTKTRRRRGRPTARSTIPASRRRKQELRRGQLVGSAGGSELFVGDKV